MTRINIQLYNNSNPKMSNIFKNNSRFAGLIDKPEYDKSSTSVKLMKKMGWKEGDGLGKNQDGIKTPLQVEKHENNTGIGFEVDEKKINTFNTFKSDNNSFKNDGYRERRYNRYNDEYEIHRFRQEREAQERARKQEEEIRKQKALTPDNFPDLVLNKKEIYVTQEQNYLEKLKKVEEVKDENAEVDSDLKKIKPGWILLKKDNSTGKTIMKGDISVIQTPELPEEDIIENVINALVELHERRTQEYIEFNGYDTWEQMFKFPGWREWEKEFEEDSDEDYDGETENSEEEYM